MRGKFGSEKQRKLNSRIREVYGRKYRDWYHLTLELYAGGMGYDDICLQFAALGVSMVKSTLCGWIKTRERLDTRKRSENSTTAA